MRRSMTIDRACHWPTELQTAGTDRLSKKRKDAVQLADRSPRSSADATPAQGRSLRKPRQQRRRVLRHTLPPMAGAQIGSAAVDLRPQNLQIADVLAPEP